MFEKPPLPQKHSDEWVSKLIELSSESIYCYEKYLLEETDWKQLAVKMKSLQTHISKYMGGAQTGIKGKKNIIE